MNFRGQANGGEWLIAILLLVIFVPVIIVIFSSISCTYEKGQITNLEGQMNALKIERDNALAQANFYKAEYETLRDYNITKQDFVDLKAQINDLNYQYTSVNNQLFFLNQSINQKYSLIDISLALNFALLPFTLFTLFDFVFLDFRIYRKVKIKLIKIKNMLFVKREDNSERKK